MPGTPHLDGTVGEHLHSKLLLLQLQAPRLQLQASEAPITELQNHGCPAGVVAHLHPQDTLPWPSISNMLQAIDGGPGEDDVYVGQDEEHEQGLAGAGRGGAGRAVSGAEGHIPPSQERQWLPVPPWELPTARVPYTTLQQFHDLQAQQVL